MAENATSSSNCKRADDGNSCHWVIKYWSKAKGDFPYPRTFFLLFSAILEVSTKHKKGKITFPNPLLCADKAKRINKKIHLGQKPGIHFSSLRIATTVDYNKSFF